MAEVKKEEIVRQVMEKLGLDDLLRLVWLKSQPYRMGFLLGFLAIGLTLGLIITGQKSARLEYSTRPQSLTKVVPDLDPGSEGLRSGIWGAPTKIATATASSSSSVLGASKSVSVPKNSVRPPGKIDLNTASPAELESLPGIGPVMAKAIADYRAGRGGFKSVDELDNVKGIGPKTLEKLRPLVTVEYKL